MSKRTEELKIRISPEDKERIKLKMEDAGNGLEFYSVILLQLRQVFNLDTCFIRKISTH